MTTMLIAFNGTHGIGQHLGDTICHIKVAWMLAQNYPGCHYILTLSPTHDLNFMWKKFIDVNKVEVIFDDWDAGNMDQRFSNWDRWRTERNINGQRFDIYKELYRRIDGGNRQGVLCGHEAGLGRKNIFEYFYFGQEEAKIPCLNGEHFGPELFYAPSIARERAVYIAPYAKCQGNATFTFNYWNDVVRQLVASGVMVTVGFNGPFCDDLIGNPKFRKIFPCVQDLVTDICRHRLVACGNTGIGWVAGACGIPLLAMQPVDSHFQDYRYEWCGVKSLIDFMENPDVDECVRRIMTEIEKGIVVTTDTNGYYDALDAAKIRHLEESRALGTKLVVALRNKAQADVLAAIRYVDEVRVTDDPLEVVRDLRPAIITGPPGANGVIGKDFIAQYGGEVIITGSPRTTIVRATRSVKERELFELCQEAAKHSVNPPHKMKLLADELKRVLHLPGDIADLGCYKGGTSWLMKRVAPDKTLHVFDTFAGNPHDDPLCHHKVGEWAVSLEEVKNVVGDAEFHPGVFPESAAFSGNHYTAGNLGNFCFVYVDMDTYQSTRAAIDFFWPRLPPGGAMVFDDYEWEPCAGVAKAVDEFFSANQRHVNKQANACVIRKESS